MLHHQLIWMHVFDMQLWECSLLLNIKTTITIKIKLLIDPLWLSPTADCGAPPPLVNGFLQSYTNTTEGSVVVFQCDSGFAGSSNDRSNISASCSTSVSITAVVSCTVSFIIGVLVGAVVHYCTVRKKCDCQKFYSLTIARKQQQQQPAPVYEDVVGQSQNIELKENVAYGPVHQ